MKHISSTATDKSHCVRKEAELLNLAQCDLSNMEIYNN